MEAEMELESRGGSPNSEEGPSLTRPPLLDRAIDSQGWLDPVGEWIQNVVGGFYGLLGAPGRTLRDLMHGTHLGHALHPALTDVPLGAWTVAVVADYAAHFTNRVPTAVGDIALAVGLVGGLGALVTGYTDHHDTFGHERRTATLHGLLNTLVMVLMAISLAERWFAPASVHPLAVGLVTAGYLIALLNAFLGGHLILGMGAMVNHNAWLTGPEEFVAVGKPSEFQEGKMRRIDAAGTPVLVVRLDGRLYAIANTCAHAGGPLDEGSLDQDVVTCPWHGSRYCVRDGGVRGGPSTFDQPPFLVREEAGLVEVRMARPPY